MLSESELVINHHAPISCRLCSIERGEAELDSSVVLNRGTGRDHQKFSHRETELKVAFYHPFILLREATSRAETGSPGLAWPGRRDRELGIISLAMVQKTM